MEVLERTAMTYQLWQMEGGEPMVVDGHFVAFDPSTLDFDDALPDVLVTAATGFASLGGGAD